MDNNKIDPRAFQAETVYEQQMAGVVGAGPSMANEAASVAQGTDEPRRVIALLLNAMNWWGAQEDGIPEPCNGAVESARALLAQAAPPAAPVQDAGLKAAADFIQRKADDYAREFGSGDMGSLSFGNDAMRDYQWGLLELADEIRALAAPAVPAAGESGAEKLDRLERVLAGYEDMPATPPAAATRESGADLRPTDDELWDQTLIERDRYHEIADDLAAQIAAITGVEIGEHSSANDPWQNAMLAADDFIAAQLRKLLAPPAAEAASQPGEMGAGVPESTNQGEQKCQSKLNVMLLRSVAPVTQDNTSLGDVSRSTSIGAANSMVGSAIRTGDGEAQNYRTADGMPTERAVLEREWRKMRDQLAALPAESAQQDEREAFAAWIADKGISVTLDDAFEAGIAYQRTAQVQADGEDKQPQGDAT